MAHDQSQYVPPNPSVIRIGSCEWAKELAGSKYKVGQQWSYSARPGEEKSYLIILKIDDDPKLGRIIHIALRGLKMKNRRSPDGVSENVNHMPFLESATIFTNNRSST